MFLVRSMNHEKECETKTVTRTPSRIPFSTPFMEKAENCRVLGKTVEIRCSKHASTLGIAMVTKGGRRQLKTKCIFLKISSFEKSDSFNSVAQGVLEMLEASQRAPQLRVGFSSLAILFV